MSSLLHYIHDPLCGWCYAATPLVEAVRDAGIPITLHGGGLWEPATRLGPQKSSYIRESDARIAALTGMTFGTPYLSGLLADAATLFWSRPTIAAILAAETIRTDAALPMLRAIQHAHYVDGRRVVEPAVLADVGEGIGLERAQFLEVLNVVPVDTHIADTRERVRQHGLRGFPGFVLERDADFVRVPHEPFYGQPQAFRRAVGAAMDARSAHSVLV